MVITQDRHNDTLSDAWPTRYPGGNRSGVRRHGVTVVIAACDRPDSLTAVLACVKQQTFPEWNVHVVGDQCDSIIAACVGDMADDRIRYNNLAKRCGAQYGPNSVGLYFAQTEYVAFLNHDDLWLPDHLERAVTALKQQRADLYLGKAVFAHPNERVQQQLGRPVFSETNVPGPLWRAFAGENYIFEPASSWLVRTELALRNGPWRPGFMLRRTSLQDWLLRAWRLGPKLALGEDPTVLKFNLHHTRSIQYAVAEPLYRAMADLIAKTSSDSLRALIADDLARAHERGLLIRDPALCAGFLAGVPEWLRDARLRWILAWIYRLVGTDLYDHLLPQSDAAMQGFNAVLRARTGNALNSVPTLDECLSCVDVQVSMRS